MPPPNGGARLLVKLQEMDIALSNSYILSIVLVCWSRI